MTRRSAIRAKFVTVAIVLSALSALWEGITYCQTHPAPGLTEARRFWSFQALRDAPAPSPKHADWARSPIDQWILSKLEEKGLSPAPPADKRTLLRRATYDLIGLPPTAQELDAFAADVSPDAFAKVVDRLLSSPHYGEHWGRHWLDIARYGDTRWVGAAEDRRLPFAYTYRDWVISAINQDMPYSRFVTLQLAADQLPGARREEMAALGFLTDGKWFTGNLPDVIDDQIDVVSRGLMGLTVQCARCHDHKFDPISMDDYYSLYGLLGASRMPVETMGVVATLPEISPHPLDPETEINLSAARDRLGAILPDRQKQIREEFSPPQTMARYMVAAQEVMERPDNEVREFARVNGFQNVIFSRWAGWLKRTSRGVQPIFGPWHAFAGLTENDFASKAAAVATQELAKKQINKRVAAILSPPPVSQEELAARYADLFAKFDRLENCDNEDDEAIRQLMRGNDSPIQIPLNELSDFLTAPEKETLLATRRTFLQQIAGLGDSGAAFLACQGEEAPLLDDVRKFLDERRTAMPGEFRSPAKITEFLLAAGEGQDADDLRLKSIANAHKISQRMLQRWIAYLHQAAERNETVFMAWRAFVAIPESEFASRAEAVIADLRKSTCNPRVIEAFDKPPASLREVSQRYASLIAKFDRDEPAPDPDDEAIRRLSAQEKSLTRITPDEVEDFLSLKETDRLKEREGRLTRLWNDHPGASPRAMVLHESPLGYDQKVFVRGTPGVTGTDAPGRFLAILSPEDAPPFHPGRGRLELARAIVDPSNPLTARVIVNRVWLWHFGQGLVRTPSDFGIRGDRPSHPEMLDLLAHDFLADGGSLKKLHRRIMLSAAYQQSSEENDASRRADPENRLLWHMERRRLNFEETRDSLLAVADHLDPDMGGRPDDLTRTGPNRRTIYGLIDRTNLPGFYRAFDFPGADVHCPARHETVIAQQALFMMNNPFIMDQSWYLAHRREVVEQAAVQQHITALYRLVFQRRPSDEEMAVGVTFIGDPPPASDDGPSLDSKPTSAWRYGFGSFSEKENRVVNFTTFPFFGSGMWRGGPQEDDPMLGRCYLNSRGGNAGSSRGRSVIRRWIAPGAGTFSISGLLSVQPGALRPAGGGVRGRIVSSRHGQLGSWIAFGTEEPTNLSAVVVRRGDTIDFIAQAMGDENAGGFSWAPVLHEDIAAEDSKSPNLVWDAAKDFGDIAANRRQYGIWERYAQVLLESNEFLFLD